MSGEVDAREKAGPTTSAPSFEIHDLYGRRIWSGEAVSFKAALRRAAEQISLAGADLANIDLEGVDLGGADLRGASLSGADLDGANLAGANLAGADLEGASLRGADLRYASLERARLEGAALAGASFDAEDLPRGFVLVDGAARADDGERERAERDRQERERERVARSQRLSELLAARVVAFYARARADAAHPEAARSVAEIGAHVRVFLRQRATAEFLEAHRRANGYALTLAAIEVDDVVDDVARERGRARRPSGSEPEYALARRAGDQD